MSTASTDQRIAPGGGVGIVLGYGINERVQAFVRASSGYRNSQVDLGARYRFGAPGQGVRPYAELAVSGMGASRGVSTEAGATPATPLVHAYGYGITAGAGVEYTLNSRLGLDLGLVHTRGVLGRPADRPDLGRQVAATRIHLGVTWRP